MTATLDLSASFHGWVCSNCKQLYDAYWRPISTEKAWAPPVAYNWPADKPTFRYCSNCGALFSKQSQYEENEELRT